MTTDSKNKDYAPSTGIFIAYLLGDNMCVFYLSLQRRRKGYRASEKYYSAAKNWQIVNDEI